MSRLDDQIYDTLGGYDYGQDLPKASSGGSGGGGYDYGQDLPKTVYPTTNTASPSASFNLPVYNTIGGYIQQYTGKAPTYEQVSQWGSNIDPAYLEKIRQSIYSSPDALAFRSQPTAQPQATSQQPDWSKVTDWTPDVVRQYFASRGVTPNASSPEYWAQKWQEFGQQDPAYFLQRLSTADEFGGGTNFSSFSDPAAQLLEQLALGRVRQLGQPVDRTRLNQYIDALLQRGQENDARAKELAGSYSTRADELRQAPYSAGDEAVIRAKAFDQFERRRQETLKNAREGVYARGFAPTSGLAQDAENQVNTLFEQARTQKESDILQAMMDETQRRRDKATQLDALAAQALNGGDATTLQYLGQIADLEDSLIGFNDRRSLDQIAAAGIPVNLGDSRTALALSILGGGQPSSSPLSSILQLLQYGQNQQGLGIANKQANLQGLGGLLSILGPLLGGGQ